MKIVFPDWFDELLEFESEAKGCLQDFPVFVNGQEARFTFYDPVRLNQDLQECIDRCGYFHGERIVVLQTVNKKYITLFIEEEFR